MNTASFTSVIIRIVCALALMATLGFCILGFMATYEPLTASTQWLGRAIYGTAGAGCLFGIVRLLLHGRHKPS